MEISLSVKLDPPPETLAAQLAKAISSDRLPGRKSVQRVELDRLPGRITNVRQTSLGVQYQSEDGMHANLRHGFIVDRFGRGIFHRATPDRLPIVQLYRRLPNGDYALTKFVRKYGKLAFASRAQRHLYRTVQRGRRA